MSTHSKFPSFDTSGSKFSSAQPSSDSFAFPADGAQRRAQIEREQQERAAERQQLLAQQTSPHSTPDERVQLWERLHGLSMPQSPTHQLLRVIAAQTDLSLQQLHEIQRRRAPGGDSSRVEP